ncbi:MAG: asparagine synthase (glutamine-hydrolyzing) [Candidatus Azotimanducaceae bacterium]|jgi:asparagine synthase (glutamine-hydrolysing)
MCGIFGTSRRLSEAQQIEMTRLLNHRGPDSQGQETLGHQSHHFYFAHTRLAIQDLSAEGHQPMFSRSGRWAITYNGELYNHHELRASLKGPWRGNSDTETLIEHIDEFGVSKTLNRLNGIFAFAAFDLESSKLYLCRDTFGVKPVYYTEDAGNISFASEMKPLIALQDKSPELHQGALSAFLSLRYTPSPETLLTGIHRLPPGHLLVHDRHTGSTQIEPYLTATNERFEGSLEDAVTGYRQQMSDAVSRQLISDVPVGVLLSGGIDSAVIAALAREHSDDLTAFTVGFGKHHPECELSDAAETARVLDIRHESVEVVPETLIEVLDTIITSIEEPLGTTSIMPMWYLTQLARQKATVVLAGQGNDEPWGGYRRYQIELLMQKLPLLREAPFRLAGKLDGLVKSDGYRRGLQCLGYSDNSTRFLRAYSLFDANEMALLGIPANADLPSKLAYWSQLLSSSTSISDAERMMRIDTRMNLADDLLLYGDKVSMAFALELRVPMLDPGVVQFVESLPLQYKASMRQTKIAHRMMAAQYLPAEIINRPKKGFQVPFGEWSRTVWKDYVASQLLDPGMQITSVLDPKGLRTIWDKHQSGSFDYSRQLFALLTLSLWMQRYLTTSDKPLKNVA